jgi:hypothetical protein
MAFENVRTDESLAGWRLTASGADVSAQWLIVGGEL